MTRSVIVWAAWLWVFSASAAASTYVLNPQGTGSFPDIQSAFNSVADGDTILLEDGHYTGVGNRGISTNGRNVLLSSICENPDDCVIDAEGLARGFSINHGETSGLVLRGVTVQNGYTEGEGGGIYIAGSSPTIENCVIQKNRAHYVGGGLICANGAPYLSHCTFTMNESIASMGGAIRFDLSSIRIEDCEFIGNRAQVAGAIFCYGDTARILRCTFLNNEAIGSTGAGAIGEIGTDLTITDCHFEGNAGEWGGAIISRNCRVYGSTFVRNTANVVGGAAVCNAGDVLFRDCVFLGNVAQWSGAIHFGNASGLVENCTFVQNAATEEAAGIYVCDSATLTVSHCIIAFSPDGEAVRVDPDSELDLDCTNIYGNLEGDWIDEIADQFGVDGNICENPLFCDMGNDNVKLHDGSPCAPHSPPNPECGLIGALPVGCEFQALDDSWVSDELAELRVVSPCRGIAVIQLTNRAHERTPMHVAAFDLVGRRVALVFSGSVAPGVHEIHWPGVRDDGAMLANGVYLIQLTVSDKPAGRGRLVLLR